MLAGGFVGLGVHSSGCSGLCVVAVYVREVKTASGATALQVVWSSSRGSKEMDH